HGLVGAAVQRAEQGVDAGRDAAVDVGVGGADDAHCGGGAVQLMVGVEQQEQVERLGVERVQLAVAAAVAEQHVQQVADVVQGRVRGDRLFADGAAVDVRSDRRQLGQQPDRGGLD